MKNIDATTPEQTHASTHAQASAPAHTSNSTDLTRNTDNTNNDDRRSQMRAYHLRESLQHAEDEILHPTLNKDRLIALTDAILAIIMTVLVLELPKPAIRDWSSIWGLRMSFFSYAVSFFWIGELWSSLNRIWEHVYRINQNVILWTLILLFFTSFMPYATSLDSRYFNSSAMQGFYGIIIILITLTNLILHTVIDNCNRDNPTLLTMTYAYRRSLVPDICVKIAGLVITLTLWAPAMTWSILLAWLTILLVTKLMEKRTIEHLKKMRSLCAKYGTVPLEKKIKMKRQFLQSRS
jgi:uncharacterized membrane protein